MEYIFLLLLSILFILFFFFLCLEGDIFAPTIIMCIMFFISTFIAVLNGREWKIDYCFEAYFLITTGIAIFGITEIIFKKYTKSASRKIENKIVLQDRSIKIQNWKIIFTVILDFCILFLYYQGMKSVVAESGYGLTNIQYNYRRITSYEAADSMSMWILLITKFLDASAYIFFYIFINNAIINRKLKKNILLLVPVIIFCVKTLLSGGRQDILKIIFFGLVVSYILYQQKKGWKLKVSFKYMFIGMLVFLIMIPLFYYALELTGRESSRTLFQVLSTYVGGSIQQFNQYVQSPVEKSHFFGNETLTPILNMLGKIGLIDYHNTVHLEFRRLGVTIGNVYTFFRRPLQDYGIGGMYIFTAMVSAFFSFEYHFKIRRMDTGYKQDIRNMIYAYLFYWIMLSSIEQYSMTMISAYTVLAIMMIRLMSWFYFRVDIVGSKAYIKPVGRSNISC